MDTEAVEQKICAHLGEYGEPTSAPPCGTSANRVESSRDRAGDLRGDQ